ncbi:MAG: 16S rRNA (adenine(1518)-N(6)/adenine(1519)-N(6))-dimethyltransferase RsmA [Candidatus Thermoplasmatota archaeon]|nr:16S rRNA (adenine(1518)-N(6)/adenine(1519)-N(6))-dimethyltransferase RsmA [Candidatus Thermoplasmatota archaeon]
MDGSIGSLSSKQKNLGQNFLTDRYVANRIIETIPQGTSKVIEIGPGKGILTEMMLTKGIKVMAIEIDNRLSRYLKDKFKGYDLELINDDIMNHLDGNLLKRGDYIISNLPFYLSSNFILRLLEKIEYPFEKKYEFCGATIMFQKEFANRLLSHPGSKDYSRISISTRSKLDITYSMDVDRTSFDPMPVVDATVVVMKEKDQMLPKFDGRIFEVILERCFANRRKKIKNLIPKEINGHSVNIELLHIWIQDRGFDQLRPENLSIFDYIDLSNEVSQLI